MRQCLVHLFWPYSRHSASTIWPYSRHSAKHNLALLKAQCKHNLALLKTQYKHNLALLKAQCKHNLALLKAQCKHSLALLKVRCKHTTKKVGAVRSGDLDLPLPNPRASPEKHHWSKHTFDTLQSLYDHSCMSTSLCPVQQNTFTMKDIVSTQHCHEQINKCCQALTAAAPL